MSRFRAGVAKAIATRRAEIDSEWEQGLSENELLGPEESGRSFMERVRQDLQELLRGRSLWFDHEDGIVWHGTGHGYQNLGLEINEEDVEMIMTEEYVLKLDHVTDRLKELLAITILRIPSDEVRSALDQATRCYLHGLFEPSAALCRVALEAALADNGVSLSKLEKTIDNAKERGLLTQEQTESAHRIRLLGNDAAHCRPVGQQAVTEALWDLKQFLQNLYVP